ncbi:hypothetical protein Thein_2222 [Thermodesulfatator indicus DSM 15286]|uniref:4Fe-4S ferredoxin-type domain-containing protein n=1 Tax=Thermodesulfatator indicus (strain DSM 15286 / JCM 11887 / CIR29812) TaxID=667014 RepID=F8AE24_THEID|nr:hypothetical protein Thein_2222 [Thermodesulfatator indicus DSM 15286]
MLKKTRRSFLASLLAFLSLPNVSKGGLLASPVKRNHLRPPGAVSEDLFAAKCVRCGRCAEICPYHSIRILDIRQGIFAGTPIIEVEKIPCYLCMKCVEVCPTGTLLPVKMEEVRMGVAVINKRYCITWVGQALCRTCYNVCPLKEKAIKLDQLRPVVIEENCTGCGLCTHSCPLNPKAINIEPIYAFRKR